MKIYTTSREDYLKAIYVLEKRLTEVHSVDVARYMGVSKPSVSRAVSGMEKSGLLTVGSDFSLHFTDSGRKIAEKTYERHQFFTDCLIKVGVDPETATEDACKLEHAISDTSFEKLRCAYEKINSDGKNKNAEK